MEEYGKAGQAAVGQDTETPNGDLIIYNVSEDLQDTTVQTSPGASSSKEDQVETVIHKRKRNEK